MNVVEKYPRISIGVLIMKNGKFLLGKRKKFPIAWGLPGGKLDFGEGIEESILREVDEEIGARVKNLKFLTVTNDILNEINEHFVTIIMGSDYDSGKVILKEPEKCEDWSWFDWKNLPKLLSLPVLNLLKQGAISEAENER